jgi:hypothetical protein
MKTFRACTGIVLVLFFLFHIFCTLFYTLPDNFVPQSAYEYSKKYMTPLFDQGWSLFAPVPEVNKKVYVRYCNKDNWSEWQEPFDPYLQAYQKNRISVSGKIVLAMNSTLHYLYAENKENFKRTNLLKGDTTSGYFKVLKHALTELSSPQARADRMQMLVVFRTLNKTQTFCMYYESSAAK